MKKIYAVIITFLSLLSLQAQDKNAAVQKYDTVYMANGNINIGSITAINDNSISFTYKGETLGYTFKTADISKIIFSSGRVQNFNDPAVSDANNTVSSNNSTNNNANADHHNKAAVLPFSYINTQQQSNTDMGYKIQNECYIYLSNKATAFTIQDPQTTNALLGKAGVTADNIRNFTMQEICNILGVEYIVRGTVTTNLTSTSSSGNATYDSKKGSGTDKNGNADTKSSGNVFTSSSTQQNFQTSVLMEIYSDDGKKVFGQDRTSFWDTVNAYKNTIQYLLKKSPIYGR